MRKAIFLAITCFLLVPVMAVAQVPQTMSYQGMLRDDATQGPIPDGNYTIAFRLYSAPSGGSAIWSETQSVPVDGGLFSTILGNSNPLSLPFDQTYWITIQLSGQPETTPRAALTSVPYALRALTADVGDDGDWMIDGDNIYRLEGRVGIGVVPSAPREETLREGEEAPRDASNSDLHVDGDFNPIYTYLYEPDATADGRAGLYAVRTRVSQNDGTSFTPNATNNAITGFNVWGDQFTFGVAGFSYHDYNNCGGVLGADRWGDYWGALGFMDDYGNHWGFYTPNYAFIGGVANVGGFAMSSGAVDGYVLTCSATGHGTWQPASGGGFTLPYYGEGDSSSYLFRIINNGTGDVGVFQSANASANLASVYATHEGSGRPIEAATYGTGPVALFDIVNVDNTAAVIDAQTTGTGPAILGYTHGLVAARFESDLASSGPNVIEGIYTATDANDGVGVYGESIPVDFWGIGGQFRGGFTGCQGLVSPAGNNAYYGVYGDVYGGSGTNYGVYGYAGGGSYNYAGYFAGNAHVTGTLSKGGGSFKIDHPLDPENKYLYHSFVESPDMMNVYNGNVQLDSDGEAWIEMPEWFDTLNRDFRYQLTPIGAPGPNLYVAEQMRDNRFQIGGGTAAMTVSWQVTGVRQDRWAEANRIPVEEWKSADERGLYMHPAAFSQPESRGIEYEQRQRATERQERTPVNKVDRDEVQRQRVANQR